MKVNILNPFRNSFEIKATELPSRGVLYPDLIFRLKPYTVGDILAISSSTLTTQGKVSTILAGIETLKPFDLENLVSIDLDALALLRFTISSDTPVYSYIYEYTGVSDEIVNLSKANASRSIETKFSKSKGFNVSIPASIVETFPWVVNVEEDIANISPTV